MLVLHLLYLAAEGSLGASGIPEVSAKTVENAARLLTYFKSHTRRVHQAMKAWRTWGGGERGCPDHPQLDLQTSIRVFLCRDLTRDLARRSPGESEHLRKP